MIAAEFGMIQKKLHASYSILSDRDDQSVWYEALKEFDFSDVDASVSEYIYGNTRRPTIADIVDGAVRHKRKRTRPIDIHNERTVKCPYCNDKGWINTKTPTGVWVGRPCTVCDMGRKVCPGYFLSDEEWDEVYTREEKQGLRPCRHPFVASKEQYLEYCYGES